MLKGLIAVLVCIVGGFSVGMSIAEAHRSRCQGLPNKSQLRAYLVAAAAGTGISAPLGPGTDAGGLFGGSRMWGAVVNRKKELCALITSTVDPMKAWLGSEYIAEAKAYTANAFSVDVLALSTARLYTFVQPGHSLFGLNQSNPFNPQFFTSPAVGKVTGGIITFGGGVPLYNSAGQIIGGLGVSGDTSCADHEIAKRVRHLAGLNPPGGPLVDDIVYAAADGPSLFAHSLCQKTWRNGVFIGNEAP